MTCDRCAGCLVKESIYRHGRWWWRCLNCGDRSDGAILYNRAEQEAATAMQRTALERDLKEWSVCIDDLRPLAGRGFLLSPIIEDRRAGRDNRR